ncbi:MAG: hypothetical protein K1X89_14525 [Myxococcaceae bacterium]|nr:hypothetical protein [Myxococcaceae bacterium]
MGTKLPIRTLVQLENARYGHVELAGTPLTGELTQLARQADGLAGKPRDGFVERDELQALKESVTGKPGLDPALRAEEAAQVGRLLGYEANPAQLERELAHAEAEASRVFNTILVMSGRADQVSQQGLVEVLDGLKGDGHAE